MFLGKKRTWFNPSGALTIFGLLVDKKIEKLPVSNYCLIKLTIVNVEINWFLMN